MNTNDLISIFQKNLSEKGLLFDKVSNSNNPLHSKDIFPIVELLSSAAHLLDDLSSIGLKNIPDFQFKFSYPLQDQVYIKKNKDKNIIYLFHNINKNELTEKFSQCLGTLNSPNTFGKQSNLNIKGLLLNIFEVHNHNNFIFPSWCNVFLIDGLVNRAMPNVCLSSIEPELSNPIDFYPDALKTLSVFYDFHIKDVGIDITDIFTTAPKN